MARDGDQHQRAHAQQPPVAVVMAPHQRQLVGAEHQSRQREARRHGDGRRGHGDHHDGQPPPHSRLIADVSGIPTTSARLVPT